MVKPRQSSSSDGSRPILNSESEDLLDLDRALAGVCDLVAGLERGRDLEQAFKQGFDTGAEGKAALAAGESDSTS